MVGNLITAVEQRGDDDVRRITAPEHCTNDEPNSTTAIAVEMPALAVADNVVEIELLFVGAFAAALAFAAFGFLRRFIELGDNFLHKRVAVCYLRSRFG